MTARDRSRTNAAVQVRAAREARSAQGHRQPGHERAAASGCSGSATQRAGEDEHARSSGAGLYLARTERQGALFTATATRLSPRPVSWKAFSFRRAFLTGSRRAGDDPLEIMHITALDQNFRNERVDYAPPVERQVARANAPGGREFGSRARPPTEAELQAAMKSTAK